MYAMPWCDMWIGVCVGTIMHENGKRESCLYNLYISSNIQYLYKQTEVITLQSKPFALTIIVYVCDVF